MGDNIVPHEVPEEDTSKRKREDDGDEEGAKKPAVSVPTLVPRVVRKGVIAAAPVKHSGKPAATISARPSSTSSSSNSVVNSRTRIISAPSPASASSSSSSSSSSTIAPEAPSSAKVTAEPTSTFTVSAPPSYIPSDLPSYLTTSSALRSTTSSYIPPLLTPAARAAMEKQSYQSSSSSSSTFVPTSVAPTLTPSGTLTTDSRGNTVLKSKAAFRTAAGDHWIDPTMADWPEGDYRIFVGDLGNEVTDDMLRQAFARLTSLQRWRVVRDKRTGKTRGFGFVSLADPLDFVKAMREINGRYIGNRPCKLRKCNVEDRADPEGARKHKNIVPQAVFKQTITQAPPEMQ
eukprot:TRINITY_DN6181_c1_g1_i4.p1 TRINITY_DN6181_c1_g1~~TRINITY_DN6181_c1_g1_i4.p1  ORF type:complete len:346 (-),score=113.08 TRINITY_DN6181_c1_g1_i4:24-1061(-)